MDSKDSRPSVSCVPPEIWRQIIFNLDLQSLSYSDLAVTWTNLRGVSRFFQAEIEALFQEMVLPGMKFDLWLSTSASYISVTRFVEEHDADYV